MAACWPPDATGSREIVPVVDENKHRRDETDSDQHPVTYSVIPSHNDGVHAVFDWMIRAWTPANDTALSGA